MLGSTGVVVCSIGDLDVFVPAGRGKRCRSGARRLSWSRRVRPLAALRASALNAPVLRYSLRSRVSFRGGVMENDDERRAEPENRDARTASELQAGDRRHRRIRWRRSGPASPFRALPADTGAAFVVVVHLDPQSHSDLPSILAARTRMPVAQVGRREKLEAEPRLCHSARSPPAASRITRSSAAEFDEPRGHARADRPVLPLACRAAWRRLRRHPDRRRLRRRDRRARRSRRPAASSWCRSRARPNIPRCRAAPSRPASPISCCRCASSPRRLVELVRIKEPALARRYARQFDEELLRRILAHLRVRTGHDFSKYKRSTVVRRIARRMQVTRTDDLRDYYDILRDNAEEAQALLGDLLISVTTFFRDSEAFETLRHEGRSRTVRRQGSRRPDPRLGAGLRHRRGGLLDCDAAARGSGAPRVAAGDPGVWLRSRRRSARDRARGPLSRRDRGGCQRGSAAPFLHPRGRPLSRAAGAARHRAVREPQPAQGSAVLAHRPDLLPQPAHLPRSRAAAAGLQHFPLRAEPGRLPASRLLRDRGQSGRAVSQPSTARRGSTVHRAARATSRACCRGCSARSALHERARGPSARLAARAAAFSEAASHRQALEKLAPPSILVDETHRVVHLSENAGRFLQPSGGPLSGDVVDLVRPELRFELRSALHRVFEQRPGDAEPADPGALQRLAASRASCRSSRPQATDEPARAPCGGDVHRGRGCRADGAARADRAAARDERDGAPADRGAGARARRACARRARNRRRPTRNCAPPMKSCNRSTRNIARPPKSSRPARRSCNRSTRSCRPSTASSS